ncbi:hypothetical protein CLV46_2830 [Diaminobutyricimonas aerilata]|uniref:Tfp pilus assembly protein PilN n=1 Tax=Diaminobutyricimonas aerilata TaxID=1162967 RepID=A0A2M9CN14_9MICO|nr:hypothetical protein [Diaminobutyricimonas aerilata]PJJ73244.1 hypothetical protein CLV46_2830 [Diaminobutyricimonas aerilata]
MSARAAKGDLVVGGSPRVDLLPVEIRERERDKVVRRWMIIGAALAVIVVGGAYGLFSFVALQVQSELQLAQARTDDLLTQQLQYTDVRVVENELAVSRAAARVGTATEIDWTAYVAAATAALPAGATITGVSVEGASPLESLTQPTVPLGAGRIATMQLTASFGGVPDYATWLGNLAGMLGASEVMPNGLTQDENGLVGIATVSLTRDALVTPPAGTDGTATDADAEPTVDAEGVDQ